MKRLKIKNWLLTSLLLIWASFNTFAQQAGRVEMADELRADGKIYVVVLVMLIIIVGLAFLAFRLDRKVSNIEKRLDQSDS